MNVMYHLLRMVLPIVVVMVSLAACGSNSNTATSPAASGAATSPAASKAATSSSGGLYGESLTVVVPTEAAAPTMEAAANPTATSEMPGPTTGTAPEESGKVQLGQFTFNVHETKDVQGQDDVKAEADSFYFEPTFLRGTPGQKLKIEVDNEFRHSIMLALTHKTLIRIFSPMVQQLLK